MKRSLLTTGILTSLLAGVLAISSFASSPDPTGVSPRLCFRVYSPVCTNCPKSTNDYCWPEKDGPFKSCQTLAPEQACAAGYCSRVDPGPTGCNSSYTPVGSVQTGGR